MQDLSPKTSVAIPGDVCPLVSMVWNWVGECFCFRRVALPYFRAGLPELTCQREFVKC